MAAPKSLRQLARKARAGTHQSEAIFDAEILVHAHDNVESVLLHENERLCMSAPGRE